MTLVEFFKKYHEQSAYLNWDLPIRVCMSAAGYYIGQRDTDGSPYTRLSVEYYRTADEAQEALDNESFTPRLYL